MIGVLRRSAEAQRAERLHAGEVMLAETPDCGRVALMKHFRPANLEE